MTDERSCPQLDSVALQQRDCEGNKSTSLSFLTGHPETNSDAQGVGARPDPQTHVWSDALTGLDGAWHVEPQFGSPEFIMPLAPLCSSASFVCRTNSNLDGDQTCAERTLADSLGCHRIRHNTLCPTDGITDKPLLKGHEVLIYKNQNVVNSTEKSSQDLRIADTAESFLPATSTEEIWDLDGQLANFSFVPAENLVTSEEKRVAYITLDLENPFASSSANPAGKATKSDKRELKMPHKTHKHPSESKTRSKKEKSAGHHHVAQTSKKPESEPHHVSPQQTCKQQESHANTGEIHTGENDPPGLEAIEDKQAIEAAVRNEKSGSKSHGKKKKKHGQSATAKSSGETSTDAENRAKPKTAKGKIDMFEAKLSGKSAKAHKDGELSANTEKKNHRPEARAPQGEQAHQHTDHKEQQSKNLTKNLDDDVIKRRRLSGDKFGKIISNLESKLPKTDSLIKAKGEEAQADAGAARKKAYSEVVKQKIPPKEGEVDSSHKCLPSCMTPVCDNYHNEILISSDLKVLNTIQAESVSGDAQSLCLWCQFAAGPSDCTVTWSREGSVLAETKKKYFHRLNYTLFMT